MKTFYESIDDYLRENIFFIFFGCVVQKIFVVYVCISYWKHHQNSIKMHQNPKFHVILLNFNTQTLKIVIVATMCPKIFLKTFYESIDNFVHENIFFIFFGCVVPKIFVVYACISYWKYHQNSIKMHQNLKFLVILLNFTITTLNVAINTTKGQKKISKTYLETLNDAFSKYMFVI